ncbi:hypothetical protein ACT3TQ_06620 [Halomonas sp. AOP12-C2-37]
MFISIFLWRVRFLCMFMSIAALYRCTPSDEGENRLIIQYDEECLASRPF